MLLRTLFVLAIALSSNTAMAEPETIRFVIPKFKPFTYLENDQPAGRGVEFISGVLKMMNWPYTIRLVPNYGRALAEVKSGRADGFFLATENIERNHYATLSEPVVINNWSWFYFKDNKGLVNDDFKSIKKIGTILNTNTHKWLNTNNYSVSYATGDPIQLVELLSRKRLDAVFLAEAVFLDAYESIGNLPPFEQYVEHARPMGIYLSNTYLEKYPNLLSQLNTSIENQ